VKPRNRLFGTPHVEILPDDVLEEDPSADRTIKYLGKREFDLQDRELITISSMPVLGSERMRQQAQPFA
jgi:hypothetical protein